MLQPQASAVSSGCSSLGRMGCSEATGKGGIGPSASNTAARAEAFLSVPAEIKDIFVSGRHLGICLVELPCHKPQTFNLIGKARFYLTLTNKP